MSQNSAIAASQESISLYFSDGRSDKEYHATLEASGELFLVNFRYGRRGTSLQTGTKTNSPVPYDQAKKIFDKLVREKISKGYTPGESGTPYQNTELESRASGVLPQLLNPIDKSEIQKYLRNDTYVLQEKKDGDRRLLRHSGTSIVGINRKGLTVNLPVPLTETPQFTPSFLMDGELIGDKFYGFDLLELGDISLIHLEYWERYERLKKLIATLGMTQIICVASFEGTEDKTNAFERFMLNKAEGVVFKLLTAPYVPGRPSSGGDQLKVKFTESASVVVEEINPGKRSVSIYVLKDSVKTPIGNVTIPTNYPIPDPGTIVEIEYLYAYPGGSLFQPVYRGKRGDQDFSDCTLGQLKFKSPEEREDSEE